MTEERTHISFEEFTDNLAHIFERVVHDREAVLVEGKNGELVEVKPATPATARRRLKTRADYEAFLASAGGWAEVDVDTFLKENEESRRLSTRPPVEL
jgi:hypothetical protein